MCVFSIAQNVSTCVLTLVLRMCASGFFLLTSFITNAKRIVNTKKKCFSTQLHLNYRLTRKSLNLLRLFFATAVHVIVVVIFSIHRLCFITGRRIQYNHNVVRKKLKFQMQHEFKMKHLNSSMPLQIF